LADEATERDVKKLAAKDPAAARAMLASAPDTDPEPKARRFVVNDSTVEKLADLLTYNQWGLLVFRDELHGFLAGLDKPGQEGSRGFYLTAYDGNQGYAVDRILRGESYVKRVCLAMLGGMQPGKLQAYVRDAVSGGAGDDGLLQRFGLAVWPDVTTEFCKVDQWPDASAKQAAWAVFDRLAALQPASEDEPVEWRFSPTAQALFWEWALPFETEIRGDALHPALVSHLSKYRKLVPALALIFAMVDTPDSGNVVDEPELLRALAWVEHLRSHAERIYSAATTPATAGAAALLAKIKAGRLCDTDGVMMETFTPRQVAVKNWAGLGTPDDVRKAADLLVDYGWLASDLRGSSAKGGRPSERYHVNPMAMKGGV
jgi:putative DNA primase/helicase